MKRRVLLVQLPIPQPGPAPARGNVPLAAGYLHLYARRRGLEADYDFEILPPRLANTAGDQALADAILARDPWMVGFTCYLWNVERSLWVAREIKRRRPDLRIVVGGPEITTDNDWVLRRPEIDFAAIGEGEQTFAELLAALRGDDVPRNPIAGLYVAPQDGSLGTLPAFRQPLSQLDVVSSPYLDGILDAAEERMLFLETLRGCIFKCKFCYYPKSYDDLYFLSEEKLVANLRHAAEKGVREVVLLDPTLNQRRDFGRFLRRLADCNPGHAFTYFGELRAEGIDAEIAALLRDAHFTEVEIGLQSTDVQAQRLMDRRNSMRAYERGVRALLDAGIHVKVDLIVGLPGDTLDSVRCSIEHVQRSGLYTDVQVFNLAVLPGTAFRSEAASLGLEHQQRPPYYVLRTPALDLAAMYALVAEAEAVFDIEFDALPPPDPPRARTTDGFASLWRVDLDRDAGASPPPASQRAQAFTLWLQARDLAPHARAATGLVRRLLDDNPHTTLQVVLEAADLRSIVPALLEDLLAACYAETNYLDRYDAFLPGPMRGSKRCVVLAPAAERARLGTEWIEALQDLAAIAWHGGVIPESVLDAHEFVWEAPDPQTPNTCAAASKSSERT